MLQFFTMSRRQSKPRPIVHSQSVLQFQRAVTVLIAVAGFVAVCGSIHAWAAEDKSDAAAGRLMSSIKYLASDELEGRGAGTKGIDLAADYIAEQFAQIGLDTKLFDGTPFQRFTIRMSAEMGSPEHNALVLRGPGGGDKTPAQERKLKLGKDFNPLAIGGSAKASGALVFVGYGITANQLHYDDYAGMDVKGKVVLMLRKEPQQGDRKSVFNGLRSTTHATFQRKVANAQEHGAAAVIMVNDAYEVDKRTESQVKAWREATAELTSAVNEFAKCKELTSEQLKEHQSKLAELAAKVARLQEEAAGNQDVIVSFASAGPARKQDAIPVFFCQRDALDPIVRTALGMDLTALEKQIEKGPTPHSQPLKDWRVVCESSVVQRDVEVRNVIGVLPGRGALADQTIVVGAHYDHLGFGRTASAAAADRQVYNGADDNASGTAAVIEVARRMAADKSDSRRRMVFVAFAGEERGLLGSAEYVRHPPFPLDQTFAMVNMDMVGRLRDDSLTIGGSGSAKEFDGLLKSLNERYEFQIKDQPNMFGRSDHASFYRKEIPVLFFFTGLHADYHRPSDDYDKINVDGMLRIADFVSDLVGKLERTSEPLTFRHLPTPTRGRRNRNRPYLGVMPDMSRQSEGVVLMDVVEGGPAAEGGLRKNDRILKFDGQEIKKMPDLAGVLGKHKVGDKVEVVIQRDGRQQTVTVTLGKANSP